MAYSDRELLARIIQCEAGGEGDNRNELQILLDISFDNYFNCCFLIIF